jgi:hypothetical protein
MIAASTVTLPRVRPGFVSDAAWALALAALVAASVRSAKQMLDTRPDLIAMSFLSTACAIRARLTAHPLTRL